MTEYANNIVNKLLKLRLGDYLSVNCEECDFKLAKIVADAALEITKVQVKIVVTENGKPVDVIEFDPPLNPVKPVYPVFLRIAHNSEKTIPADKVLDMIVEKDNLAALHKLGHLAEPIVLDRKIAVPYCVVPSEQVFYEKDIEKLVLENDYKRKFLNTTDIDGFHVIGDGNDFRFDIPEDNVFTDCHISLSGGRDFICSTNFEQIRCIVDMKSLNGTISGTASIFGKEIAVNFKFIDGKLVSYTDNKQLNDILSFDEKIKHAGYFVLQDKASSLYLGGSLTDCLKKLPESEEELPDYFNTGLYSIKVQLPSDCNIFYKGCDDSEHDLVRKGLFIR